MKKKLVGLTLALTAASTAFATASFAESNSLLVNGSFENFSGGVESHPTTVTGWSTTDSQGRFEVSNSPGTYGLTAAADGSYFLELNAWSGDTISQTVATTPGMTLKWSLKHANRDDKLNLTQTVQVKIGSGESYSVYPSETAIVYKGETAVDAIGGDNSTTGTWTEYTGYYTVPEGQTETTFSIASMIGGGSGNMLDDIQLIDVTEYAAKIGDTRYTTLREAVTAAKTGETITLLADVTDNSSTNSVIAVTDDREITVDLDGHTVTAAGTNLNRVVATQDGGKVTVLNGKLVSDKALAVFSYNAEDVITLKNVDITYTGANNAVAVVGQLSMENCTVTVEDTTSTKAALAAASGGTITVNGGTYTGGLSADEKSSIIINSGTFTANPSAYVPEGTPIVEIDGKYVVNPDAEGKFAVTTDSGYYGEYGTPTSGIIAFNAAYTGYEAEDITKFGLYLYVTGGEKVSVEATTAADLVANAGKFFATVSDISADKFDTQVFAIPYVVKGSAVSYGEAVSTTVNAADKWLGDN